MGLNFTIDMTWGRLILLSLMRNDQKINHQTQGVPANGDCAGALWFQQLKVRYFGTPCTFLFL